LCICLMVLLGQCVASAASIYIAPTGNDTTGNGSISNPYRTLAKASSVAVAGDTVYARGGTYLATKDSISCNGTAGNPITFTEYPGEQAIFDGTGASFTGGDCLVNVANSSYVVIDGFEVRNAFPTTLKVNGILVWDEGPPFSTYVVVRNCIVHNLGGAGIGLIGDQLTAEGNEVYNVVLQNENGAMGSGGWNVAIKSNVRVDNAASTNITFRNNYVHEVWGEGIDALCTFGATIEGNTVANAYSVSIYLDNAKDVIVRNNVAYTTPENERRTKDGYLPTGILMASERYTQWTEIDISNVQTYNNLIYRADRGIEFWRAAKSYNNLKIYHNTVVAPERNGFEIQSGTSSGNELKDNIIYGGYANANPSAWVTSYNCWPNGVPTVGSHPNSFAADPLLVNPTGSGIPDGFKLRSGSPCINTGTSVGIPTDYWGTARDANPDIGFHEYVGGPVPPNADFSGNPRSGNPPLTVAFTDLSTGSPTSWSWTFGDGGTSTAQNPSHQYTAVNSYTVSLTATNAQGSDTETKPGYITVANQSCHVGSIALVGKYKGTGAPSGRGYYAEATITAHDQACAVLAGVTVNITWSGCVSGTDSGTTNASGQVVFTSPVNASGGTFTCTVTNLTKSGYPYNSGANHETSKSIQNP